MKFSLLQGDVLDAIADGIVLTIDGAGPGMEGNIARAFARRWPEAWREIQDELRYPIPLGQVFDMEIDPTLDCPFRVALLASTLHHSDTLQEGAKRGVVKQALAKAIDVAIRYRLKRIAVAVMAGGWRLSPESAFMAMLEAFESAYDQSEHELAIEIYIVNQANYHTQVALARTMGWTIILCANGVQLTG